jgi:hypothetical protein
MKNYSIKEIIELLKIDRSTFYRYIKNNDVLKENRIKIKNKFFYNEKFLKNFESVLFNETEKDSLKTVATDETVKTEKNETKKDSLKTDKTVETVKDNSDNLKFFESNFINELKIQYLDQINDLKQDKNQLNLDKEILQKQLNNQIEINLNNTNKIESLLLNLLKITNKKELEHKEEIKEVNPEVIIKEVQKTVEEKNKVENKAVYYKNQLEQANQQAIEYKRFKDEKENLIEKLKEEYQKAKFFEILKKARIKKELEKAYLKGFDFVQYV